MDRSETTPRFSTRAYLWEGGFLAIGRGSGRVPPHSHHAVQISIALEGTILFHDESGEWRTFDGAVVRANETHGFDGNDALLTMLFIDPETLEGRWLHDTYVEPISAIDAGRIDQCRSVLLDAWTTPPSAEDASSLVVRVAHSICAGIPATRRLDGRIADALVLIRSMDVQRISIDDVARGVFLSPSRFAHLFKDELGLPFRRYLLWRKLTRALLMAGRGETLSTAAHAAGFSDSAHLTRTFYQMFGISPTAMMGGGELYEIEGPFAGR
jgi:AraC family transcriptional regulator